VSRSGEARHLAAALCFAALGESAVCGAAVPEAAPIRAQLVCPSGLRPGRVLCTLSIHGRGARLAWGDALVVEAPDFARPLRARVGFEERSAHGETRLELPIALVAVGAGAGQLQVRARAVVCEGKSLRGCAPASVETRAALQVLGAGQP
jgi:hypothetical protein